MDKKEEQSMRSLIIVFIRTTVVSIVLGVYIVEPYGC